VYTKRRSDLIELEPILSKRMFGEAARDKGYVWSYRACLVSLLPSIVLVELQTLNAISSSCE